MCIRDRLVADHAARLTGWDVDRQCDLLVEGRTPRRAAPSGTVGSTRLRERCAAVIAVTISGAGVLGPAGRRTGSAATQQPQRGALLAFQPGQMTVDNGQGGGVGEVGGLPPPCPLSTVIWPGW